MTSTVLYILGGLLMAILIFDEKEITYRLCAAVVLWPVVVVLFMSCLLAVVVMVFIRRFSAAK